MRLIYIRFPAFFPLYSFHFRFIQLQNCLGSINLSLCLIKIHIREWIISSHLFWIAIQVTFRIVYDIIINSLFYLYRLVLICLFCASHFIPFFFDHFHKTNLWETSLIKFPFVFSLKKKKQINCLLCCNKFNFVVVTTQKNSTVSITSSIRILVYRILSGKKTK